MSSASRGQRQYQVSGMDTPSTANLLSPSGHSSVQAALLRGPRSMRANLSSASLNESPYPSAAGGGGPISHSISDKFSLSPDPASWGSDLSPNHPEPDDYLHNPDPRRDRKNDTGGHIFTYRGLTNLGCLIILVFSLVALFAGYPIITFFTRTRPSRQGGFNIGGLNASGQIPKIPGNWGLIDVETPQEVWTRSSFYDSSEELELVFSDEFNTDGRTFYPGDDPYWEAVDLHYWQTDNLEWNDPSSITTKGGALEITLSATPNHNLNYTGGMVATWNKFCFTGGLFEANVSLPGANNVAGLWPAVWAMGNLGRAGYGASLEGMWPYTYDSCDYGTVPNQSVNGLPIATTQVGDPYNNNAFSYLPGQKLSRCTCSGESHPGPMHSDGTFVGRSAPEIDVLEALVSLDPVSGSLVGQVSQSGQYAPFTYNWTWPQVGNSKIYNPTLTTYNPYKGGAYQQAVSALTTTDQTAYELNGGNFSVYGFEYVPGTDNAYVTWVSNNQPSWTLLSSGMGPDTQVEIGARPIPQEPMYLLLNLGMSPSFGVIDFDQLTFPTTMRVDYIRVYQPKGKQNIGCDPPDFPTMAYINQYIEAYTDPNLTTWKDDFGQPFPKNKFLNQC